MPLLPLSDVILESATKDPPIPNNQDIPKSDMDIFYRDISAFYPDGKTSWDQLTDQEKKDAKAKYRWDPFRPGCYQAVTAVGKMSDNI